ncbi:MAG: MipA/OmpV family protein [Pseudomonadota bacterium]
MRVCLLLALAAPLALAQPTRMDMPEGTYDAFVGLTVATSGKETSTLPWLSVQWPNGVFLTMTSDDGMSLGLHLSDYPTYDYGPLLTMRSREQRSDTGGGQRGWVGDGGGFFAWHIDHSLDLQTQLIYGGGSDQRGLFTQTEVQFATHIASHHDATLTLGAQLANQSYLQSYFGVNAAQAAAGGTPMYQPRAGLFNTFIATQWDWQLANKWWMYTGLRYNRLAAAAAASPLVDRRGHGSLHVAFAYHY